MAAPATVVPAAAVLSLVAEVVTIPLVVVSSCRAEEAAAVVAIVPTGVGVEDPAVVVAVDVKSVSKVLESVVPVVTPPNEVVVTATVVVSSTDSVVSLSTGAAISGVVSTEVVVSSTGVMAEPGTLVVIELVAVVVLRPEAAVFVVGARAVAALAGNEVAPALEAPTPRFVEGGTVVAPTLVEGVAVMVVAAIAGDVAPVFAKAVMAVESSGGVVSSAVFASASEASVPKSDVMVEAEVKRVVEPASGFMEVAAVEAADSWNVDSTEGVTEATRDVGAVVVEAAPIAE